MKRRIKLSDAQLEELTRNKETRVVRCKMSLKVGELLGAKFEALSPSGKREWCKCIRVEREPVKGRVYHHVSNLVLFLRRFGEEASSEVQAWQQPFSGYRWQDMPGLSAGETMQKLNFALFRRGLLTEEELENSNLRMSVISARQLKRKQAGALASQAEMREAMEPFGRGSVPKRMCA